MTHYFFKVAGAKFSTALVIAAFAIPTMSVAEQVKLRSYDGSTQMIGALVDYDDGRYRLDTALGELLISAHVVTCEGALCPSKDVVQTDLLMAGDIQLDQETNTFLTPSN